MGVILTEISLIPPFNNKRAVNCCVIKLHYEVFGNTEVNSKFIIDTRINSLYMRQTRLSIIHLIQLQNRDDDTTGTSKPTTGGKKHIMPNDKSH